MAGLKIEMEYDGSWANRIDAMLAAKIDAMRNNPVIVEWIEAHPTAQSVDDLTNHQKAGLWVSYQLMIGLIKHEGQAARELAHQTAVDDVTSNFPLKTGVG